MRRRTTLFTLLTLLVATSVVAAEAKRPGAARGYPPQMPGTKAEVYKTVGDVKLNIYIVTPEGHRPSDKRPAIVFFFGGGWRGGSPRQFLPHCRYLASRGMVAMAADYRVSSRHGTKADKCVADAKSAVRWIRANAARLGVDPERIAAGGGSAGGHIAACTGTIEGFDEPGEDTSVSSVPNAMVLFNPALVLAPIEGVPPIARERVAGLAERMGTDPVNLSPYHRVKKGAPPAIVFHGTADTTVPFKTTELFAEKSKELGNRCQLVPAEGQPHGFFNFGRGDNKHFLATVRAMDQFLADVGWLEGKPMVEKWINDL